MNKVKKRTLMLLILMILAVFVPIISTLTSPTITAEAATKVKINKTKVTLYAGGNKVKLKINGTKDKVTWKSSNSKIAKVTKYGYVYGIKKGSAIITATIGKEQYKCKVTVISPYVTPKKVVLKVNNTEKLTLKGVSDNSTIIWTSSDEKIATISKKGILSAKEEGTVKITATVGKKKYSRVVTVKGVDNTSKVNYLGDRSIQYSELEKEQTLLFALKDENEQNLVSDAFVDIKIINDAGETVYDKTHEVTSNNFNNWTSSLYGTRLLCSINIPDSEILKGSSKSGTIYFTVYYKDVYNFEVSKLTVNNLPYNSPASSCTLELPSMPFVTSEYDYHGSLESTIKIDEITYLFEESYDNQVKLILKFTGEKIFGSSSNYDKIEYKLYKDGYVIDSGNHYTPKLASGDKFKDSEETIYDLEPGNYKIEFTGIESTIIIPNADVSSGESSTGSSVGNTTSGHGNTTSGQTEIDNSSKINTLKSKISSEQLTLSTYKTTLTDYSIKLSNAKYQLSKAENNKKVRVYRAGQGFVYEADQDAVRKAQGDVDYYQALVDEYSLKVTTQEDLITSLQSELDALS